MLAGLAVFRPEAALAACTPFNTGNANDNIILCDGTNNAGGADVSGGGGADTITLNGGTAGAISGGNGADTINLNGGSATSVAGDGSGDTITLDGATITGTISGDNGDDIISLKSGSAAAVSGGLDLDHITLEGATIAGAISGEGSADTIDLKSGQAGSVSGGTGIDTITLDGATINGAIAGDEADDKLYLYSGSAASVSGDAGDDTIVLDGTAVISGQIHGGANADTIDLLAGRAGSVDAGTGFDTVTLDGATIDGEITGNTGDDTINLYSGSAASVFGDDGDDKIVLQGTAVIAGAIAGGSDEDTIDLLSGQAGSVDGGYGIDTITLNGATVLGAITGGGAADTIDLLAGSAGSVSGGDSGDTITLDGATISGTIAGDDGMDIIKLLAGSAASVTGNSGTDTITLDGATITGSIEGNVGDDAIHLVSGTAAAVDGGAGSDTIDIDAASFGLSGVLLSGGSDVDLPDLSIDTLNFNDQWSGTLLGANVTGFEIINLNGGTVGFSDGLLAVGRGDGLGLFVNGGGTLDAPTALSLDGDLTLGADATLTMGGAGLVDVSGDLRTAGLVDMSGTAGLAGNRLAVGGDYEATGAATLRQDLDLAAGTADRLDVGGATSGTTQLAFNITGLGGIADDIVVVHAEGVADGLFETVDLPAGAGLASYTLLRNDAGDWVVRSTLDADLAGATIGSYADILAGLASLQAGRPVAGFSDWCGLLPAGAADAVAAHMDSTGSVAGAGPATGYATSSDMTAASFELGAQCGVRGLGPDGDLDVRFGIMAGLLDATARSADEGAPGSELHARGLSLGLDGVVRHDDLTLGVRYQRTRYAVDATSAAVFADTGERDFSATADVLSLSAAYAVDMGGDLVVTPGLGLDYLRLDADSFATPAGEVTIDRIEQLTASLGLRADWRVSAPDAENPLTLYGAIGLEQPLGGGTSTTLAATAGDITMASEGPGTLGRIRAGVNFGDADDEASGFAQLQGWLGSQSAGFGLQGGYRVALP